MSVYLDPEALALLFVQQYLSEQGHTAALSALEESSGFKYDDDKPKRGSELMELVYQQVECQLAADEGAGEPEAHTRHQQLQQQHAKLQEELTLRSAAADYPSFLAHTLGPFRANLLSVLTWPGDGLIVTGGADGAVRLLRYEDGPDQQIQQPQEDDAVAVGGSNGSSSSSSISSEGVWVTQLGGAGGVLTLAWHPAVQAGIHRFASAKQHPNCMLLAGCMDGSVHLLHAATGQLLASEKPHSKYVVAAAWAPVLLTACEGPAQQQQQGEQLIATAAYDSTCCLLRVVTNHNSSSSSSSTSQQSFALDVVQQVPFSGYVQDVCFLPPGAAGPAPSNNRTSSSNSTGLNNSTSSMSSMDTVNPPVAAAAADSRHSLQLVVAVRGTNCLNILDVKLLRYAAGTAGSTAAAATGSNDGSSGGSSSSSPVWSVTAAGLVNMSEAGDSHVSFSAMRLAVSPCTRYLLIVTDSPILLVLRLSDWGVVRRLYGLDVDKFHNASIAWHRSSSYIMAGAAHAAVYVYHLGTAKVVAQLKGHTVNVRCIHYDPATNRLATCSFDKSVKVYEQP